MRCFVIFGKRGGSLCTTMKQVHQIQGDYVMWKGIGSSTIILLAAQLVHAQTANRAWPYWGGRPSVNYGYPNYGNAYPAYGNNYANYPGYSGNSNGYPVQWYPSVPPAQELV